MKYLVYGVSPNGAICVMLAQSPEEVSTLANEMLRQGLKDVTSEPLSDAADRALAREDDEPAGLGVQLHEEAEALAAREGIPFDDAFRRVAGLVEPCVITRPTPR